VSNPDTPNQENGAEPWINQKRIAFLGMARLPFKLVPAGLRFCVKEPWLHPTCGEFMTLTWEQLDTLKREAKKLTE
jgi:hypothetical protein